MISSKEFVMWMQFTVVALCLVSRSSHAQTIEWIRQFGTASSEEGYGVSVDGQGNVYITGYTYGNLGSPNAGGADAFISKYDAAGNALWNRQLGTTDDDLGTCVSADSFGNVYIAGRTGGNLGGPFAGGSDSFISKYDGGGVLQWTRQTGGSNWDETYGISVDAIGNIYIAGRSNTSDGFIAKYSATGTRQWTRQLSTPSLDTCYAVTADSMGNIYVAGQTNGSLVGTNAGGADAFISRYDSAGNRQWLRQLGTTSHDLFFGLSADDLGNVYVSGWTGGNLDGPNAGSGDAILGKYDAAGDLQWVRQLGTGMIDISYGVTTDGLDNIYISGRTDGGLHGQNIGETDAFVSNYDSSGALQWTRQLGTRADDTSTGLSTDSLGNVYLSGWTLANLGGQNAGGYDALLIKLNDVTVPEPATWLLASIGSVLMFRRWSQEKD